MTIRESLKGWVDGFLAVPEGSSGLDEPRAELDTVRFGIPCISTTLSPWVKKPRGERFQVDVKPGVVYVEVSLPKFVRGDNVDALPLEEAMEAIEELYRRVGRFVQPDPDRGGHRLDLLDLQRVDLVRDFDGVTCLAGLLDGLEVVPRGSGGTTRKIRGRSGRAETLYVGTDRWEAVLYSKWLESKGLAPEGRVRFEARLRNRYLRSAEARRLGAAMVTVGDLTEERIQILRRSVFERVGFHREVRTPALLARDVYATPELSAAEKHALWAYLTAKHFVDIGMVENTRSKYRDLSRDRGLAFGRDLADGLAAVRLDYEAGREVIRWGR
jgi:hypothetical protein